jgi:hypothetical protein
MLEALRHARALRAARRAAASRRVFPPEARPEDRRLFAVLPRVTETDRDAQREAWQFLSGLPLAPSRIVPVVFGRDEGAPDAFAGSVLHVSEKDVDWRGLPKRVVAEALWSQRPDVALDLTGAGDVGAAYLVGGSPAAVRVGSDPSPEAAAFYDLVVTGGPAALRRALSQIEPPVLPV